MASVKWNYLVISIDVSCIADLPMALRNSKKALLIHVLSGLRKVKFNYQKRQYRKLVTLALSL